MIRVAGDLNHGEKANSLYSIYTHTTNCSTGLWVINTTNNIIFYSFIGERGLPGPPGSVPVFEMEHVKDVMKGIKGDPGNPGESGFTGPRGVYLTI